jgi:hypothetical protein
VNQFTPSTAQVEVGDGYLRVLCGCTEPAGTLATAGSSLTCTAPAGTTFFILFLTNHTRHQIVSTGAPAFPPSPVSTGDQGSITAHAFSLATPGTYAFRDSFNAALTGQLVVF